jgi:hypothetical protein
MRFDGNGVVYNCFNCKFTTGWQPGSPFGEKMKTLSRWLGAGDDIIKEMIFEALKTENEDFSTIDYSKSHVSFEDKPLPEGSLPLKEWIQVNDPSIEKYISEVVIYLVERGYDPLDDNFYWSPESGYESRVIIPFRYQGRIVGNTARKVSKGNPKYLSDQHPHFVFNLDAQQENQRYIFVCEGPFDALAVGGVALLTNDIAEQQARLINSLGGEIIVIPDQDTAGLVLFDRAAELGWSVAMPNWNSDVKDAADAVQKYGKLFVVVDAIQTAQKSTIKINMAKKQMVNKLERLENV